jgi:hypothetical protein
MRLSMTPKKWTLGELQDLLDSKLEKSGTLARWGTPPKGKQRTTTIGAIFVPRPPTQEELNRTPEEREARITQYAKELKELFDKAEEDEDEDEDEDEAYPI